MTAARHNPTPMSAAALARRAVAVALVVVSLASSPVSANPAVNAGDPVPASNPSEVANVKIERDRIGALVPLDAAFTDSTGRRVRLGDYFRPGRPVVLNLVYYNCPMMCTLALNGTQETLGEMKWTPGGEEFDVVTVSFSAAEGPELAAAKKKVYLAALDRPGAEAGWHFLTGDQDNIDRLTEALGYRYEKMPNGVDYAHASALYVLTPEGRVSQILGGIAYDAQSLRLSLVEASGGKLGTLGDIVIMFCAQYDPVTGRHQIVAAQVMKLGGAAFVLLMGAVLVCLWRWDRYRRNLRSDGMPTSDAAPRTA